MNKVMHYTQQLTRFNWVAIFLTATFFTLPISSTGKSICAVSAIIAILLDPANRQRLSHIAEQAWCRYAVMLFVFALVACFWSPASFSERFLVLEKYSKLLYLPILVAGFSNKKLKNYCLHAFLAATLLTCCIAILKFYGLLGHFPIDPENVFRNHIITGFMVGYSCYLSLYLFSERKNDKSAYAYLLMAFIYTWHVLLVNGGRTGYVVYFLLMGLLVIQLFSWKQALIGLLMLSAACGLAYQQSSAIHERVDGIKTQLQAYQNNQKDSSIGFRFQFHDFAHQLFLNHPILGNGTASFTYSFRTQNPVPGWGHPLLEPHSQYWLTAAEFGLVGILLLGLFFISLLRSIWRSPNRLIGLGIMIPFLLGCLSDSLLFYSGSGYFFLLFVAMSLRSDSESS